MSLEAKISSMQSDQNIDDLPQTGLARTLEDLNLNSHIDETVARLNANVSKNIIESGARVVIKIDWDGAGDNMINRVNLSVREGTVAFIGNQPQFTRLKGDEIKDADTVENALASSFDNPLNFKKSQ